MNSVIIDINEMSDSKEAYEARPHKGIAIFIYSIIAVIAIAVFWMCFTKLDVSIKANGIFRQSDIIPIISTSITGKVKKKYVKDGDYVEKGDVIASLEILNLDEDRKNINSTLSQMEARKNILEAYCDYLDGNKQALDNFKDNQYYNEINNKIKLLDASIESDDINLHAKTDEFQVNIDALNKTINDCAEKVINLYRVEDCIIKKYNDFNNSSDAYYFNIVSGYISEYNTNVESYDAQITSTKNIIEDSTATIDYKIKELEIEKKKVLDELTEKHIANIEEIIEVTKAEQAKAQSSLDALVIQRESLLKSNTNNITILSEKGNIEAELSEIKGKIEETKNTLVSYNEQEENGNIKAEYAGYIQYKQEISEGMFISSGSELAAIYPESNTEFYAEVYVENGDIGKIKKNQNVKFEVSSYPSSEYGYLKGTIDNISSDIITNSDHTNGYYVVKVKCDMDSINDVLREDESLINGLACQAKIITDEKSVFRYVIDKIDLFE